MRYHHNANPAACAGEPTDNVGRHYKAPTGFFLAKMGEQHYLCSTDLRAVALVAVDVEPGDDVEAALANPRVYPAAAVIDAQQEARARERPHASIELHADGAMVRRELVRADCDPEKVEHVFRGEPVGKTKSDPQYVPDVADLAKTFGPALGEACVLTFDAELLAKVQRALGCRAVRVELPLGKGGKRIDGAPMRVTPVDGWGNDERSLGYVMPYSGG